MPLHRRHRDREQRIAPGRSANSLVAWPRLPEGGKIPAWFFHVVSSRHPTEFPCHEVANCVGLGYLAHGGERAKTVHRNRPLIFNSVAALDVLSFSFVIQVGPRSHTNSHCHPHF